MIHKCVELHAIACTGKVFAIRWTNRMTDAISWRTSQNYYPYASGWKSEWLKPDSIFSLTWSDKYVLTLTPETITEKTFCTHDFYNSVLYPVYVEFYTKILYKIWTTCTADTHLVSLVYMMTNMFLHRSIV